VIARRCRSNDRLDAFPRVPLNQAPQRPEMSPETGAHLLDRTYPAYTHYPVLLLADAPDRFLARMPSELRAKGHRLSLEEIFDWSGGGVRLIVFAADRFSANRKMFSQRLGAEKDIRDVVAGDNISSHL
jgi:hypothetical protein